MTASRGAGKGENNGRNTERVDIAYRPKKGQGRGLLLSREETAILYGIISAPDHALIARLLCEGKIRWESSTNELCFNGLRYSTELDEFGVPVVREVLRAAIGKATEGK